VSNIAFSDETSFHIYGYVNIHKSSQMQPLNGRHTPKVNIWLGFMQAKIYGPVMFSEGIVCGNNYLDMLQQFLEPQPGDDGIFDTAVFQQDGAPPHSTNVVWNTSMQPFPRGG
jgi:hypothetical protein